MTVKMFAVYDSKAAAFLQPFFSPTEGTALRAFEAAANDADHQFHQHAGDYTLFEIGEWDDQAGKFDQLDTPFNLAVAITMIRPVTMLSDHSKES